MFKNRKIIWASLSALVIIVVLIASVVMSHKGAEKNAVESATAHETVHKEVKKDEAKQTKEEKPKQEVTTQKDTHKPTATKSESKTKQVESKPEVPTIKSIKPLTKYVNISSLNVRSGPGTNHSVVSVVTQGQSLTVSATSGSWDKVAFGKKTGWVSGKYLSTTKPVTVKVEQPAKTSTTKKTATKISPTYTNDADRLKSVDNNKQLILVTASSYSTTVATIQTFEKDSHDKWHRVMKVSGHVGKRGMGKASEGDTKTPVGKYSIGTAFGQYGNPGTKMPWRNITSDDVWVDDPGSSLYNTWQSKSKTKGKWDSAENMKISAYVYGFVINYNTARVPGAGSAIFFHVGSGYTLGCVDTAQSNVVSILKWLDPAKNPAILITATQDLGKY